MGGAVPISLPTQGVVVVALDAIRRMLRFACPELRSLRNLQYVLGNLFHKLRRGTITYCAKADPIVAQKVAGHKDFSTTLNSYIDETVVRQKSAIDVLYDPLKSPRPKRKPDRPAPSNDRLLYESQKPAFRIFGDGQVAVSTPFPYGSLGREQFHAAQPSRYSAVFLIDDDFDDGFGITKDPAGSIVDARRVMSQGFALLLFRRSSRNRQRHRIAADHLDTITHCRYRSVRGRKMSANPFTKSPLFRLAPAKLRSVARERFQKSFAGQMWRELNRLGDRATGRDVQRVVQRYANLLQQESVLRELLGHSTNASMSLIRPS